MTLAEHKFAVRFGQRLRELREAVGCSQDYLAEPLGLTRGSISNIERGTQLPKVSIVPGICRVLECDPNELFDYGDKD